MLRAVRLPPTTSGTARYESNECPVLLVFPARRLFTGSSARRAYMMSTVSPIPLPNSRSQLLPRLRHITAKLQIKLLWC